MKIFPSYTIWLLTFLIWGCDNPYKTDDENPDISYNVYFQDNGREKLGKYLHVLKASKTSFLENYDEAGELDGDLTLKIHRPAYLADQPEDRCKWVADKLSEVILNDLHNPEDYDSLHIVISGVKGYEDKIFAYGYSLISFSDASFSDTLFSDPHSHETQLQLAEEAIRSLDYDGALSHLNEILEYDDQHIRAMELRAEVYKAQKNYYSAVFQYAELIAFDSLNIYYLKESVKAHIEMEQWEDALTEIKTAIRISGQKDPESWFLQGKIHSLQQMLDTAESDFTAAILLDPDYAQAYYYRGIVYKEKAERTKACEDFQKARDKGIYSEELDKELNRCRILGL